MGMDADTFQAALAAHSLSMDAVLASLREMQARQNAHDAKLDKLLSVLQAGTQLRDKPADIIDWEDIRVSEERVVGARSALGFLSGPRVSEAASAAPPLTGCSERRAGEGGFGRVYIGEWRGSTARLPAVARATACCAAATASAACAGGRQVARGDERRACSAQRRAAVSARLAAARAHGHFHPPLRAAVYHEANVMAALPAHPNVVRYYGCVLRKPQCALVMEFCAVPDPRGPDAPLINSLLQLLRARAARRLPAPRGVAGSHAQTLATQVGELELTTLDIICICTGVAHGMEHLHRAHLPYRSPGHRGGQ